MSYELRSAYIGLGSNLGDRHALLHSAYQAIERQVGTIVRRSGLMESRPWGFQSENDFLNAVVCVQTTLSPYGLLAATQLIEYQLGRRRPATPAGYQDRPIDIDILLYDHLTISEPDLVIPHPYMLQRDFVMRPLMEIMPFTTRLITNQKLLTTT